MVAATARTRGSLATGELDAARGVRRAGSASRHLTPRTDEMAREGYRANAGDRCFFCKAELLDVARRRSAAEHGLAAVATGTNADDAVAGFRPGIRAAAERGAVTPLRDAGLTKAQVRAASRRWGLPTWDKPAAACLSSRVAYGVAGHPARLARVERAEAGGPRACWPPPASTVRDLRVRDLGDDRARVEVDAAALAAVGAGGRPGRRLRRRRPGGGFAEAERRPARVPVRLDERAAGHTRALPLSPRPAGHVWTRPPPGRPRGHSGTSVRRRPLDVGGKRPGRCVGKRLDARLAWC